MKMTLKKPRKGILKVSTSIPPASSIKKAREEIVPINSINYWKENPRKNDKAAERLAPVLREHGQITAIVVWIKNKVAYKGNTTLKAMKINGAKEVRVQWVDFPSETAAIAYGIADNRSSEYSYWDDEILEKLMSAGTLDYKILGFTKREFHAVTLLPDLELLEARRGKRIFVKPMTITIKCEEEVLKELKNRISLVLTHFEGKASLV